MRTLTRITIAVAAVLLIAAAAQPVMANCGTAAIVGTAGAGGNSFIWTQGYMSPVCFSAAYPPFQNGQPPVTPNLEGQFWRLGTGDVAIGMGDDNGTFDFVAAGDVQIGTYGPYFFAADLFTTWTPPATEGAADGCIGGNSCNCTLLTDQLGNGTVGHFAILAASSDATFNTSHAMPGPGTCPTQGGDITLEAMPQPFINSVTKQGDGVAANVTVPPATGGIYNKDGCNCGPVGYRILAREFADGNGDPDLGQGGRGEGNWTVLNAQGGGQQPVTPLGTPVNVETACTGGGGVSVEVWLAAELVFDSQFSTTIVSPSSSRIICGSNPTLADPDDFSRPRLRPIERPRNDRGGKSSRR